jgi:hypothetical protein
VKNCVALVVTKSPASDADPSRSDYFGLTAGLSIRKDRTVTSVGGFGLQSNTEMFVAGADPARRSDARVRLYGGMLSFAYRP